jgi:hypothetical protein
MLVTVVSIKPGSVLNIETNFYRISKTIYWRPKNGIGKINRPIDATGSGTLT